MLLSEIIVGFGIPSLFVVMVLAAGTVKAALSVRAMVSDLSGLLSRLASGEIDLELPDLGVYGRFPGLSEALASLQSALIGKRLLLEKLKESEERFRIFQELSPDGFAIFTAQRNDEGAITGFRWIYANQAARRRPQPAVVDGPPNLFQRLKRVAETGRSETFELYDHRLGQPAWVRHVVVKMNDGVAMSVADVTEVKRAQLTKSSFLAAASHDLRQPFHALRLFLSVLEETLTDPGHRQVVEHACTALGAGEHLLNSLMDLSAIDAGVVGFVPRVVTADQILDWCRTYYGATAAANGLELRVVGCRAVLLTDQAALQRILGCLIDNALRVTVRGRVVVGCRRRNGRLHFEVWDNGPGIPADKLPLVFEEFYQLGNPERDRRRGLGLGLAVARRTAHALGHDLIVRSELGRGSVFSLRMASARTAEPVKRLRSPVRAHG